MRFFIIFLIITSTLFSQEDKNNPLKPNKFETPRETFQVFLKAMNDYKKGMETDDSKLIAEIDTALRCLNLESVSYLIRAEKGKETAVFLKEVLDRVSSIDPDSIPIIPTPPDLKIQKWILENTEISIQLMDAGERKDEYLFSKDTVFRVYEFYKKTKHLPYLKRSGGGALYQEPWSERYLPAYARIRIFQIYIWQILGILLALVFGILLRGMTKYISKIIIKILHRVPDSKLNWKEKLLVFCDKPLAQIVTIGFWYFCLNILDFEGAVLKFFSMILQIMLSYNLVRFFYDLSKAFTEYLEQKAAEEKDEDSIFDSQIIPFISRSTRVVIIVIGTLMTVQNLGINVMSILAGLGVGGLAFALAARDMAANLFGSVMILLDRPFKIGDSVIISTIEGDVEEIGFRCTRLRTLNDSLVSIPNAEVANAKIENLTLRRKRRIYFNLVLPPNVSKKKIEAMIEGTKILLKNHGEILEENNFTLLKNISTVGSELSVSFFVQFKDWYDDQIFKQAVYLEILSLLDFLNISLVPNMENHISLEESHTEEALEEISTEELLNKVRKFTSGDSKTSQVNSKKND